MDFILATTNTGKAAEINKLLGEHHVVRTLTDINFTEKIIEYGTTFEENAIIKAKAVQGHLNGGYDYILADDSGLSIDVLNGEPGVQSAYWMGSDTPYDVRNVKVLELLSNIPEEKRGASFTCVIACAFPDGTIQTAKGILEGQIAFETAGDSGFGYDPIFFVPSFNRTLAQLSTKEKNLISHRSTALRCMCNLLGVQLS